MKKAKTKVPHPYSTSVKGYTMENTRLICHECHRADQEKKGWA